MSKYKLVPVEPTDEMGIAGCEAVTEMPNNTWLDHYEAVACFKAMLAAAPAVQGEPVAGGPLHPSQVRALRRNVKRNCPPEIYALLDQAITAPQPALDVKGGPVAPSRFVNAAGINASDAPATVIRKLDSAFHDVVTFADDAPQPDVQGELVGVIRESDVMGFAPYAGIWAWLEPGTKLYTAPQPAEQQPAPDVDALVEIAREIVDLHGRRGVVLTVHVEALSEALVAHRKQGVQP